MIENDIGNMHARYIIQTIYDIGGIIGPRRVRSESGREYAIGLSFIHKNAETSEIYISADADPRPRGSGGFSRSGGWWLFGRECVGVIRWVRWAGDGAVYTPHRAA